MNCWIDSIVRKRILGGNAKGLFRLKENEKEKQYVGLRREWKQFYAVL